MNDTLRRKIAQDFSKFIRRHNCRKTAFFELKKIYSVSLPSVYRYCQRFKISTK